jgi:hypothetical protein
VAAGGASATGTEKAGKADNGVLATPCGTDVRIIFFIPPSQSFVRLLVIDQARSRNRAPT